MSSKLNIATKVSYYPVVRWICIEVDTKKPFNAFKNYEKMSGNIMCYGTSDISYNSVIILRNY